jgi:Flp pilus assembly protein TadD
MNRTGDAEIHYNLGQAYSKARQGDAARHHFGQSVALDSTYWQAWLNLGTMAALQGDLEQAKGIFRRVAQAKPQRPEAWVNLAHTFMGLKQSQAAVRAYEQALIVNPHQPRIYNELLQLHFRRGSLEEANKVLAIALEYYPQDREKLLQLFEGMQQRAESKRR